MSTYNIKEEYEVDHHQEQPYYDSDLDHETEQGEQEGEGEYYDDNNESVRAESLRTKMQNIPTIESSLTPSFLDPKSMVKYHLNWYGLPLSLFAIYHYGQLIFTQMSAKLPTVLNDELPIQFALKIRYVGAFIYFLCCLLHRPFVFECRNSEGPLLVATVLELYYMLNCKENPPTILELAAPVAIAVACFLRRKPYIRIFTNPWSKDKSELIKLIRDAKETAGLSSSTDL